MQSNISKRIVFTTWGSFGDLHPFMALALELKARGHRPAIASIAEYRPKVEAAGIDFFPLRPWVELPDTKEGQEKIRRIMDLRDGPRYVIQEMLAPTTRETYEDSIAAIRADGGADLLVSHAVPMAAPIVAARTGIKWISSVLSPISLTSVYDPATPPEFPFLRKLLLLHPALAKAFNRSLHRITEPWIADVRKFRKEIGLAPGEHPVFEAQHSPRRVLAMFSNVMAKLQPDHPSNTIITGFPFYDRDQAEAPAREVMGFMEGGEPPILFTLGSAAVRVGDEFYRTSIEVAKQLNRRALLLVSESSSLLRTNLPNGIKAIAYAPHSLVMPCSSVVVHQAGVGTTGQALRSGRPMLIVPHGQDQPDNARRCEELGVALVVPEKRYNVSNAVAKLRRLLCEQSFVQRAGIVGAEVQSEDGTRTACDAIEAELIERRQKNASNNGDMPAKLPLLSMPGTASAHAAQPSTFRMAHRERRPITSRPNPWRWELI
jgi:UDP:flavonoid glycosyltransferase YjiC (YdhE family)